MKIWSDFLFRLEHRRPRIYYAICVGFASFIVLFWAWLACFSGI